jgi:DNA-binding XRE family transcriptional regulator
MPRRSPKILQKSAPLISELCVFRLLRALSALSVITVLGHPFSYSQDAFERGKMDSGSPFRKLLAGNPLTGDIGMLDLLGLSVEKFALAIGVTRTSVYFYLSGKTLPSSNTLHRMAEVLGIPLKDLFELLPTREPGAPQGKRKRTTKRPGSFPNQIGRNNEVHQT